VKSNKKYTNVTFTRRVDHDAGRHRTPRASKEARQCELCGAVYIKRRWVPVEVAVGNKHQRYHPVEMTLCPACKQQKEGIPSGFVYLEGAFLADHRDEISRLLMNEADRAALDNPLAKIMGWEEGDGGRLTITTTTEHLAERLGQALEKAFDGKVRYDFSHENKLARVYWHRD
jgi:hypothetical protein